MTRGRLRRMRLISVLGGTALVVALLGLGRTDVAAGRAAATITVCANPNQPAADFTTIQDAITAAADGDTINICAGTFSEQLLVSKTVTLVGAGPGQTEVTAPSQLTGTQDIVTIGGGATVDISRLT